MACDAQEKKPIISFSAAYGNVPMCVSTKAREKLIVKIVIVLFQFSLEPATVRKGCFLAQYPNIAAEFFAPNNVEGNISSKIHYK